MRFVSTRGGVPPQNFKGVLLRGLAGDGGLYMPESYPHLGKMLESLKGKTYRQTAFEILSLFATDMKPDDLLHLMEASYNKKVFPSAQDVVSILPLSPGEHLLDLNAGPTLAFKDMALQPLGRIFTHVLKGSDATMNIVGATTGDTGSAAEHAVRGKKRDKRMAIFMLSPRKGMSNVQRAQMFSLQDENVFNIEVDGDFDTCQDMVKAVNEDADFKKEYRLGAVNSINLVRILLQVVYYVYAYLKVARSIGAPVTFVVPTGNFGNICAGHFARMMGLPIKRLILASNENDVLCDFVTKGVYRPRPKNELVLTSSPSMNILNASNLERPIFDLFERGQGGRRGKTKELYANLKREGSYSISREDMLRFRGLFGFAAGRSTHADRIRNIKAAMQDAGIMIDPHTADGIEVGRRLREEGEEMIYLSTASPVKFDATIKEALGTAPKMPRSLAPALNGKPRYVRMPPDVRKLKAYIAEHGIK
jgi:threonine synthase